MIILHGTWKTSAAQSNPSTFFFWAEDSSKPLKRRGRPPKTDPGQAPHHPFQASTDELQRSLKEFTDIRPVPDTAAITLPSNSKHPHPSPDMHADFDNTEKLLKQWSLQGLSMRTEDATLMLASLSGAWLQAEDTRPGSDLWYWSKTAGFALELLSKQHFIPSTIEKGKHTYAQWEYVLSTPEDLERIHLLKKSIPPVCSAFDHDQTIILEDYLNTTINACIRKWVPVSNIREKSLSRAWLDSLITGEPMNIDRTRTLELEESEKRWKEVLDSITASDIRTCFRLESPGGDTEKWKLEYFLQATDDPSLMLPAEIIWKTKEDHLTYLERRFSDPQEKLLTGLARAGQIFKPIEESLETPSPEAACLETPEAYTFLKEAVPQLTEGGFGVQVPSWWHKKRPEVGPKLNLAPKKAAKGLFSFDSVIEYNWEMALGDQIMTEEEFKYLSHLKIPLVYLRGQWHEIKVTEIEKALKYVKKNKSGEIQLQDALKIALKEEQDKLQLTGLNTSGWLKDVLEQLKDNHNIKTIPQPKTLNAQLRPYQTNGLSWLSFMQNCGLGACLADDMGLGKTIQLLSLLLKNKADGQTKPSILICPTSIVGNWKNEATRFAPDLSVMVHHGSNRKKGEDLLEQINHHDLIITTYGLIHRDLETLSKTDWNIAALDEAQNVKNHLTKQSRSVRQLNAATRIALTGTPVENRLLELWSIMEFLNPGYLGAHDSFHKEIAIPIESFNDRDATLKLRSTVQPFILRRLKTDPDIIKDLPEKIETKVHCNLTKEQATLYEAVVSDMLKNIDTAEGISRKGLVLSSLTKLKQLCNHPANFLDDGSALKGRSGKLNRITEMMEEVLSEGDNALVFTQYAKMGQMLKEHFQDTFDLEVLFLHGGIPKKKRDEMVERFSQQSGPRIFILSIKAGGVGLNLTRANHVFHFDRWWNPAVEDQATDRAFRIGQKKNVQVHKFLCDGTLEEKIDELIEKKKTLAGNIIGSGEQWLTQMSTDQLKQMLTLDREVACDEQI